MTLSQSNRKFQVLSPLGDDVLVLHGMTGTEELGRVFDFTLDVLSADDDLQLADLLGQPVMVSAELPDNSTRYFHGIVKRFTYVGKLGKFAHYQIKLVPWLWLLTRRSDCRIFQNLTVPEIIKQVFSALGFTDFDDRLTGTYRIWDYCVQYRETDFDFVSRLMEQEGIYYYFAHEQQKHMLCLADGYASHDSVAGYEEVPYFPPGDVRQQDRVYQWSLSQQVKTGTYVLNNYDFERPRADLLVNAERMNQHAFADLEMYDYPGEYLKVGDGDNYVRTRIEELQAGYERTRGAADAMGLQTGALFTLTDYHPRPDQNREYLIVSTKIEFRSNAVETGDTNSAEAVWECNFEAIDSQRPFRSPRLTRKPTIQGPQTAVVVGKQGEEIWTDKYGRVKVQFHWDRYGTSDENSSCWVRVAQVWAGNSWGAVHIPRIGQEVIVEFLEGDPDRPIITGRVYNADEMPPYALPENQTQSGIKSRSIKGANAQNFNEIRFEDKAGSEHLYMHAEKDFERVVENNDSLKVGFDKQDEGSRTVEIWKDLTETIETGDHTFEIKEGKRTTTIFDNESLTIQSGNQTLNIDKGTRTSTIDGDDTLTIKTGNRSIKISSGTHKTEAAQSIELKVGGNSITIDSSGITLKGLNIKIQGDAKVDIKSALTSCEADGILTLKGALTKIN